MARYQDSCTDTETGRIKDMRARCAASARNGPNPHTRALPVWFTAACARHVNHAKSPENGTPQENFARGIQMARELLTTAGSRGLQLGKAGRNSDGYEATITMCVIDKLPCVLIVDDEPL